MGIDGIKTVYDYAKGEKFQTALNDQLKEYEDLYRQADELLANYGGEAKDVPATAKISAEIASRFKSMIGSDERIAENMIRGNITGATKLTRQLREYAGNSEDIRAFAEKVIATEENNSRVMKKYL
jgi:hypothetical protein